MIASFLFPDRERLDCISAVFEDERPVLVSPSFRAHLGEAYCPPIAEGDALPHHFFTPIPHSAIRRDFDMNGKKYALFTATLPLRGQSERETELTLCRADAALGYMLSVALGENTGSFCMIMELFDTVGELLDGYAPSCVRMRKPLYSACPVFLSRPALVMALGLLSPDLLLHGEVEVFLDHQEHDYPVIGIGASTDAISPFTRELVCALAEGGGFAVDFSDTEILFTFERSHPTEHVFYAGVGEREQLACWRIALFFRGAL